MRGEFAAIKKDLARLFGDFDERTKDHGEKLDHAIAMSQKTRQKRTKAEKAAAQSLKETVRETLRPILREKFFLSQEDWKDLEKHRNLRGNWTV
jgi:hypothetical protein